MAKEKTRAELREEIEQLKKQVKELQKKRQDDAELWYPVSVEYEEQKQKIEKLTKQISDCESVSNYHKNVSDTLRKQIAEQDEVIKQQKTSNTDLAGRLIDKQNECDRLRETGDMLIQLIRGNLFRLIIEHYRLIIEYNKQGLKK